MANKPLIQALNALATHVPVNVSQRVLFAVCDTLAANCHWLVNTGIPNTQRGLAYARRDNRGGEIDIESIAAREHKLASMTEQMLECDAALDEAKKVYAKYSTNDYVWVPYNERRKGTVKSSADDAVEAALDKVRAKHGISA